MSLTTGTTLEHDVDTPSEEELPSEPFWLLHGRDTQSCVYAVLLSALGYDLRPFQEELDRMFAPGFNRSCRPRSGFRRRMVAVAAQGQHRQYTEYGLKGLSLGDRLPADPDRPRDAQYFMVRAGKDEMVIEVAFRNNTIVINQI